MMKEFPELWGKNKEHKQKILCYSNSSFWILTLTVVYKGDDKYCISDFNTKERNALIVVNVINTLFYNLHLPIYIIYSNIYLSI